MIKTLKILTASALLLAICISPVFNQETQNHPAIVFLVAGQSNAGGCGVISPERHKQLGYDKNRPLVPGSTAPEVGLPTDAADYTHSYMWVPGTGFQRTDPQTNVRPANMNGNMHGMELPVIRELEKRYPENDIYVIKYGPGATTLHRDWNPRDQAIERPCYATWLSYYNKAMSQLSKKYREIRVAGLYWDQGESDGIDEKQGEYATNLKDFIASVRHDTHVPELKFFIRKHIFNWPNIDAIITAQEEVVANDPNAFLLDIDLGDREKNYKAWAYSPNNGHVSSKGFAELTKRLFDGPLNNKRVESFDKYQKTDPKWDDANKKESPLDSVEQWEWRQVLEAYDYTAIAAAYADYMIEHGRDVYGKPSPLFVTGIDRHTGEMISPPFPHVKRKPFMPGWERDRECRDSDRNYGNADPLDQLALLKLLHQLTEITGEKHYAREADRSTEWWMTNCQTPIGLYPWGTHAYWNVEEDSGGEGFEFNHPWPYWKLNPDALQTYAMALWDHYVKDKNTGDFNRHANAYKHAPDGGMEFPWPGSAMIVTWVEAYLANPDPEYKRAIITILKRWESLRDQNGHLAPCTNYQEWAWYGGGYTVAANRLDDCAELLDKKEPELAAMMREYGLKCDAAYLQLADNLLDVKRVGIVKSYLRETGGYNPDRLDILGGPWQDRKDYAYLALLLYERAKRSNSETLRIRYHEVVLDAAELYMSINPEVQWPVWGTNMAYAIRLLLVAHDLTGNTAYLHRADQFGHLAVDLFLDESSPLPKITSQDNFYEIECVTGDPGDVWILAILELDQRLARLDRNLKHPESITTSSDLAALGGINISGTPAEIWELSMKQAFEEGRGGSWDCSELKGTSASVELAYGREAERRLFLSRRKGGFGSSNGISIDNLELIASDFISKIPTLEEAKAFNGPYRRKFSGKHREVSTAVYGGFKDVLDKAGLLLVNHSQEVAEVRVTASFHDSWDDRETKDYRVTLKPGDQAIVACKAPDKRFIRRLDLRSSAPGAVKLERFAFAMEPRSNLTQEGLQELCNEWGPFAVPWERYDNNPVIGLEDKETYSIQNGPQTVMKWKDKWYMFLMTSQPMVTKLAVSEDGLNWNRPHHNYLLEPEMDWEGTYNLAKASVVRDGEVWLYYFGKKDKTEMIALARSKNLENWQKEPKPIFTHNDSRIDGERAFPDCVIREGDTWYMYYDVGNDYHHPNNPDGYVIGVATSKDGIQWTDSPNSPVLTTSERTATSWDDGMVSQCSVHKIDNWYYMLYSGSTNNYGRKYSGKNRMAFGLARARYPEGPWEKYPHNPVFKPTGNEEDFDGIFLQHPCPVKVGDQWYLYYNGWTKNKDAKNSIGAEYAIGVAFAEDEKPGEGRKKNNNGTGRSGDLTGEQREILDRSILDYIRDLRLEETRPRPSMVEEFNEKYSELCLKRAEEENRKHGRWFYCEDDKEFREDIRWDEVVSFRIYWQLLAQYGSLERIPNYSKENHEKAIRFWQSWQKEDGSFFNVFTGQGDANQCNGKYIPEILKLLASEPLYETSGYGAEELDTEQCLKHISARNMNHGTAIVSVMLKRIHEGQTRYIPVLERAIELAMTHLNPKTGMFHGQDDSPEGEEWKEYGATAETMKGMLRLIGYMGVENMPYRHIRADRLIENREQFRKGAVSVKRNTAEMMVHCLLESAHRSDELLQALEGHSEVIMEGEPWTSHISGDYAAYILMMFGPYLNWEGYEGRAPRTPMTMGAQYDYRVEIGPFGRCANVIRKQTGELLWHKDWTYKEFGLGSRNAAHENRKVVEVVPADSGRWIRSTDNEGRDILTRTFTLGEVKLQNPYLKIRWSGGDIEILINGILVKEKLGSMPHWGAVHIPQNAIQALKPGENTLVLRSKEKTGDLDVRAGLIDWRYTEDDRNLK